MVMAQLKAGGDVLPDRAKAAAYGLAHRFECLPAGGTFGGVDAQNLGGVMIDGEHHAHGDPTIGGRQLRIRI